MAAAVFSQILAVRQKKSLLNFYRLAAAAAKNSNTNNNVGISKKIRSIIFIRGLSSYWGVEVEQSFIFGCLANYPGSRREQRKNFEIDTPRKV